MALSLAAPASGLAQTAANESVQQRARPDFTPIGIEFDELLGLVGLIDRKTIERKSSPLSSFLFSPSLGIAGVHESNVFLSETNTVADRRVEVSPGIALKSDWGRHAFTISADARIGRYDKSASENFEDYRLATSGRLDIHDNKSASLALGYSRRHEARGVEDDPGQGIPVVVSNLASAGLGFEYRPDPFLLRVKTQYEYEDFKDSGSFDNDVRDFGDLDVSARFGYEFQPGTTAFVEPSFELRHFARRVDAQGLKQDNYAFGALFGLTWDLTGVTFAEIAAGFSRRVYEESAFDTVDSLDYAGKIIWNATDIMTVTGELKRATEESTTPGESGVQTTTLIVKVDHELRDYLIVSLGGSYIRSDNQEDRRLDNDGIGRLGVRYLLNANLSADFGLSYARRFSNTDGESYRNVTASVGVVARL